MRWFKSLKPTQKLVIFVLFICACSSISVIFITGNAHVEHFYSYYDEGLNKADEIEFDSIISVGESSESIEEIQENAKLSAIQNNEIGRSTSSSDDWRHTPIYAPPNEKVMALISPPGLIGGYRNQMLQLLAFVTRALDDNVKYIMSNSLVHYTPEVVSAKAEALSFSALFDIDYWNTFKDKLPQIVDYHKSSNYTCWKMGDDVNTTNRLNNKTEAINITSATKDIIQNGNFPQLYDHGIWLYFKKDGYKTTGLRIRSTKCSELARQCEGNPIPYGGGLKGMDLWMDSQRNHLAHNANDTYPHNARANFHQALRPNKKWRDLVKHCINPDDHGGSKYLGIHLRVELDMLKHKCARMMETNATRIFAHVDEFLTKYNMEIDDNTSIDTMAIATYRKGMEPQENLHYDLFRDSYKSFKDLVDENLRQLNHLTRTKTAAGTAQQHSFGGREVSVVECADTTFKQYFDGNPDEREYNYGELIYQVLNYEMLVKADVFIGTQGSSFSEDVWLTRYYNGKGMGNFEVTSEGVVPIGNGGRKTTPFDCW